MYVAVCLYTERSIYAENRGKDLLAFCVGSPAFFRLSQGYTAARGLAMFSRGFYLAISAPARKAVRQGGGLALRLVATVSPSNLHVDVLFVFGPVRNWMPGTKVADLKLEKGGGRGGGGHGESYSSALPFVLASVRAAQKGGYLIATVEGLFYFFFMYASLSSRAPLSGPGVISQRGGREVKSRATPEGRKLFVGRNT